jgi:hypothetical protein
LPVAHFVGENSQLLKKIEQKKSPNFSVEKKEKTFAASNLSFNGFGENNNEETFKTT